MTEHELKTHDVQFQAVFDRRKTFEFRRNDRNFQVGDLLRLIETDQKGRPTGRFTIVRVQHMLDQGFGLPEGFCIMSLDFMRTAPPMVLPTVGGRPGADPNPHLSLSHNASA